MNWISVEIGMPLPYRPVLVAGGCAYWDGTFWYTYMERNHPRIQWDVKYWAPLPKFSICSDRVTLEVTKALRVRIAALCRR